MKSLNEDIKSIKEKVLEIKEIHTRPPPLANITTHADKLMTDANDQKQDFSFASLNTTSTFTDFGSLTKSVIVSMMTNWLSKTILACTGTSLNPEWRIVRDPYSGSSTCNMDANTDVQLIRIQTRESTHYVTSTF